MRTVKQISDITGISVRTLHYYDEIGILKPTSKSEAGYRLYDDEELETLQQILFFREFDIPLKEIKSVMENPTLDRNQILQMQRKLLLAKKERMERLISSIDDILKGGKEMDFEVFSQAEIEGIFHSMVSGMNEEQKKILVENYGSMEGFQAHFMENASREETQKKWKKVVEWYGDKESALDAAMNPVGEEVIRAYQKRLEAIMQKLVERKNKGYLVDSFEIKEMIGEYGFVQKQLFRTKHEKDIMLQMADIYEKNEEIRKECEMQFGTDVADFFANAIRAFYEK